MAGQALQAMAQRELASALLLCATWLAAAGTVPLPQSRRRKNKALVYTWSTIATVDDFVESRGEKRGRVQER
jgi:hypothetical protein